MYLVLEFLGQNNLSRLIKFALFGEVKIGYLFGC